MNRYLDMFDNETMSACKKYVPNDMQCAFFKRLEVAKTILLSDIDKISVKVIKDLLKIAYTSSKSSDVAKSCALLEVIDHDFVQYFSENRDLRRVSLARLLSKYIYGELDDSELSKLQKYDDNYKNILDCIQVSVMKENQYKRIIMADKAVQDYKEYNPTI